MTANVAHRMDINMRVRPCDLIPSSGSPSEHGLKRHESSVTLRGQSNEAFAIKKLASASGESCLARVVMPS